MKRVSVERGVAKEVGKQAFFKHYLPDRRARRALSSRHSSRFPTPLLHGAAGGIKGGLETLGKQVARRGLR